MTADELLAAWALERFRADERYQYNHLFHCPDARATITSSGWDCSCLSEVTRDDEWSVVALISCEHDELLNMTTWYSGYYCYDLPTIIEEMMVLDRGRFKCFYDN